MKQLIIHYEPFAAESMAYIVDSDNTAQTVISSDIPFLSQYIVNAGIENVKVDAPVFAIDEIIKTVGDIEMSTYSEKKIKIRGL